MQVEVEEVDETPTKDEQMNQFDVVGDEPQPANRQSNQMDQSIFGAVDLDLNMLGSSGFNVLHAACGSGNIEMTKYLLKSKKVNPNIAGKDGWKALEIAS